MQWFSRPPHAKDLPGLPSVPSKLRANILLYGFCDSQRWMSGMQNIQPNASQRWMSGMQNIQPNARQTYMPQPAAVLIIGISVTVRVSVVLLWHTRVFSGVHLQVCVDINLSRGCCVSLQSCTEKDIIYFTSCTMQPGHGCGWHVHVNCQYVNSSPS